MCAAALLAAATCTSAGDVTTPTTTSTTGARAQLASIQAPFWHRKRIQVPEHLRSIGTVPEKTPHAEDGEEPPYVVPVPGFWADAYEVSNARFAEFVNATGYITTAEEEGFSVVHSAAGKHVKGGHLAASPGANTRVGLPDPTAELWLKVDGASWLNPEGTDEGGAPVNMSTRAGQGVVTRQGVTLPSDVSPPLGTPEGGLYGLWAHLPVVHVSAVDAASFCEWDGGFLPSEEQWESLSRGHKQDRLYPWGDLRVPTDRHRANTWQGTFPTENTVEDGFRLAAPISAHGAQNTWGVFNAVGNVAEWTSTEWCNATAVALRAPADMLCTKALQGAIDSKKYTLDMVIPGTFVVKGGSFLSAPPHDDRARVGSRQGMGVHTSTSALGFRCVYHDEWSKHTLEELSEGENNQRFVPAMPTPVPAALRPHLNGEVDDFGRPALHTEAAAVAARAKTGGSSTPPSTRAGSGHEHDHTAPSVGAGGDVDWGNTAADVDGPGPGWRKLEVLKDAAPKPAFAKKRDRAAEMRAAAADRKRAERQAREYQERSAERPAALEEAYAAAERAGIDIEGDDTLWNEPFDLHAHGTFDTEYIYEEVSDEQLAEMTQKGEFGSPGTPPLGAAAGLGDFATGPPGSAGAGGGGSVDGATDEGGVYDGDAVVDAELYEGGVIPGA